VLCSSRLQVATTDGSGRVQSNLSPLALRLLGVSLEPVFDAA